jgi:DNA polymerase elongation subunit (family B)
VKAYRERGIDVAPGMKISYIVVDAGRYRVVPEWCTGPPVFAGRV